MCKIHHPVLLIVGRPEADLKGGGSFMYVVGPAPSEANALVTAVSWIQNILLGPFATAIAVIAVASIGFMMLTGRLNIRRGAYVILGCFIVFGAPVIVSGIVQATSPVVAHSSITVVESAPIEAHVAVSPQQADPYAGAALRR